MSERTKYSQFNESSITVPLKLFGIAIGLCASILMVSWTAYRDTKDCIDNQTGHFDIIEIVDIPQTAHRKPPPPPPQPERPLIPEVISTESPIEFIESEIVNESETEPGEFSDESEIEWTQPAPLITFEEPEDEIVIIAEQMPRFPGCEEMVSLNVEKQRCAEGKLLKYLYSQIKYPSIARDNNIQGRVIVTFVVEKDGSISSASILRGIGAGCDEEVLRVINKMNSLPEPWSPGKQQGRPVRVQFAMPVSFALQ